MNIKVYTTPTCPWCDKTKEFFEDQDIEYEEVNVADNEEAREEMIEKSGQMGVPVVEIEKEDEEPVIIVGYDEDKLSQETE